MRGAAYIIRVLRVFFMLMPSTLFAELPSPPNPDRCSQGRVRRRPERLAADAAYGSAGAAEVAEMAERADKLADQLVAQRRN